MKRHGIVTNTKDRFAIVQMKRHSSCGSCKACNKKNEEMEIEIQAINSANAKVGQWVEVDLENQNFLAAAFIMYVIPLIALLIGMICSNMMMSLMAINRYQDFISAGVGLCLMLLTFMIIRTQEKRFKYSKKYMPVITGVLNDKGKF